MVCLNTFNLTNDGPDHTFLLDTEWAIESLIASALCKSIEQGLHLGLQTVWNRFTATCESSHCLQGCRPFSAKFLSLYLLRLIRPRIHTVRFGLSSYFAVSFCIRRTRCEWWSTNHITYWRSCSILALTVAAMGISWSASIRKFCPMRPANRTNVLVYLVVGMSWTSFTDFVGR